MTLKTNYILILFSFFLFACKKSNTEDSERKLTIDDYQKEERYITMRDGVKLFTVIYTPKGDTADYPVLIKRTPYGCRPYGKDTMPENIMYNQKLIESGYIFIHQDMRGRWMSEGDFENVKPPYSFWDSTATDEVTDSWDTYQWITDSLAHFNGNIGQYGNSYLGWTSLVGGVSNHPNLKAILAMAPVTNFYFEDFNRYGLCALNYFPVLNAFGTQTEGPTSEQWWDNKDEIFYTNKDEDLSQDYYQFFLDRLTLSSYEDVLADNFFWEKIKAHPNYDEHHDQRNWLNYLDKIECNAMVVGGWNDEQNLFGILNAYKEIAKHNEKAQFVMGPWSHGHPMSRDTAYYLGNVFYGYNLGLDYQNEVEFAYFEHHLKGKGEAPNFKIKTFDTGNKEWSYFEDFETNIQDSLVFYLNPSGELEPASPREIFNHSFIDSLLMFSLAEIPMSQDFKLLDPDFMRTISYSEFISDPFHPVPYIEDDQMKRMAPKSYFTDDQRFASKRPDVLTFVTDTLIKDVTILGEIKALINFATDQTDADLYVKVIDVYPMNRPKDSTDIEGVKMNGYQQLVRAGYIRGRYRDGFESPKPFKSNQKTLVEVPLLDVFHTFKAGHKIMIQIQSSWFPLFDLNPQKYVEDIYKAQRWDFKKAIHTVYGDSKIIMPVLEYAAP